MKTVAFKMKLKPGFEAEYKKRHDEIWPELSQLLKEAGISEYHIFLDEENLDLIGIQNLSENSTEAKLPEHQIMKKWWDDMADIMETNPDNSPRSKMLKSVFYMK
ncbi:L-rhamnose mutarotase [Zunongwangia sp. SCSIO 43204]|uniref:L-rhamnose mutarotase n=1 Tax=Zunongwangia sp. SCSIO 43204 TaxID=2779359 RepID=UPI001CA9D683|nr:L-rhamnose mutarotase [Zunongwangia sp. SCSIO 43204]UAB82636.1 L-rhamnose mutarotase [Zunongwangia sp. SCSIO 43204]